MTTHVAPHVSAQVTAQVAAIGREPQPAKVILAELGFKHGKKGSGQ